MSEKLHILIVDDDRRMAKTLLDILQIKGYEAAVVYSGPQALHMVAKGQFDCVLTDIKMPEMNGVELYRAIKALRPELPVVFMTAYSELVEEGSEEDAIATLAKPLDINLLLSFFSSLRKERSIVIVDDDAEFCESLGGILRARGFAVIEVTDPHGVAEALRSDGQVVLLDMKLNSISGLEVLKEIRAQFPYLPVILLTGYGAEMAPVIEAALKIDAYACLYKPFDIGELLRLLTEVHHQELARVLGQPVRKRK